MSLNSFRTGLGSITSNPAGKWALFAVGAILVFSLVYSGLGNNLNSSSSGPNAATSRSGDEAIATVNGDTITHHDFDQEMDSFRRQIQQMGQPISVAETPLLNNTVLDQLINAKLQLQMAKSQGVTVSDADIAKQRAEVVDKAGLRQTLSLPPTASLDDVNAALAKNGSKPLTEVLPDETLREMILLGDPQSGQPGKVQAAFNNAIVVTDDQARQFYTQYHTRHILIDNKKRSDAQAKIQAQQILAKAQAPGADFAALAKTYSDDPGTKLRGGDDGFIDGNTGYVPEFKKAAFSLKPGEVTPDLVVSPQYGYFIIKLDAIKSSLPKDFDQKKADYITQIKQQKGQQKYSELMASLKDSAKIDVTDPALAGDRAFSEASKLGLPAQSQPKYTAALADYQKALKANPRATELAGINVGLAQTYEKLNQKPQAIAAYEAALKSRDDPSLQMTVGQLYQQTGDNAKASDHFQLASKQAWNDQGIHLQLMTAFRQLGRPDLAAGESAWLQNYAKAHPAPASAQGFPMLPPGPGTAKPAGEVRVTMPPGGGKPVVVSTDGATPAPPSPAPVKPAQ